MTSQPQVHKQLTEGCSAVKNLRAIFDNGGITNENDPKFVNESDPVFFTNHRLDRFRIRVNNLKKQYYDLQGLLSPNVYVSIFVLTCIRRFRWWFNNAGCKNYENYAWFIEKTTHRLSKRWHLWERVYYWWWTNRLKFFIRASFVQTFAIDIWMVTSWWEDQDGATSDSFAVGNWKRGLECLCRKWWLYSAVNYIMAISYAEHECLHGQWLRPRSGKFIPFTKFHPRFLSFEKALRRLLERVTDPIDSTACFFFHFRSKRTFTRLHHYSIQILIAEPYTVVCLDLASPGD